MHMGGQALPSRACALVLTWILMAGTVTCVHAADLTLIDAIELALTKNPDIAVQRSQTVAARGSELQAKSQFDWVLSGDAGTSRTVTPLDVAGTGVPVWDQTLQWGSGYEIGVSRQLRSGIILGSSVVAAATRDTTPGAFPGQENTVKLNVSLTLPLLRGAGAQNVTGQEASAGLNALASEYALRARVAQTVRDVVVAYWTYRTRIELETIAADAEQRSHDLLLSTQKLVDNEEKPRADLVLLRADYADKVVDRNAAALSRTEARNNLGRLLGIDAPAINRLSLTQEEVPRPRAALDISAAQIRDMGQRALQRRPDVAALELQLEGAGKLLAAARNNLKPQLDLQVDVGYGKASEGGSRFGFITVPGRTQSGPSISAVLNFQFPIENRAASGALMQSVSTVDTLTTQHRDLEIGVLNSVEAAVDAVISSSERIQVAKDGLASYRQAIEHEVTKQRNGFSTLIDVINVESKYVNARVNYLQLELEYAVAVVNLNYAAGELLPEVGTGESPLGRITVEVNRLQCIHGSAFTC